MDLIHFTQNKGHAVHASTKENDIIRFRIRNFLAIFLLLEFVAVIVVF